MKSYWIAATVILTAWPTSSKAYASQPQVDDKPVQQAQSSNPSASTNPAAQSQATSGSVKSAPVAAPSSGATPVANPQNKDSYILVELSQSLKAKKLKPGDKIKAEVAQDVVSHGKIIIPVETHLIGHVTEASAKDGTNSESRLGIVFDRIELKHYHDINLLAVIQSVAPPAPRRSPEMASQMLPPSMMGGGVRQTNVSPMGGSGGSASSRSQASSNAAANASTSSGGMTDYPTSVTVKESPSTNAASGTSAAQLTTSPGGTPLSVGMPQGIRGLKGLSLSTTPTANTPGPVIVSNTENVKLEYGTQILLHVLRVEPQQAAIKTK